MSICLLGTALGMLPRTALIIVIAAAARSAGVDNFNEFLNQDKDPWMVGGGLVAAVIVLLIIGSIARNALKKTANLDIDEGTHGHQIS